MYTVKIKLMVILDKFPRNIICVDLIGLYKHIVKIGINLYNVELFISINLQLVRFM